MCTDENHDEDVEVKVLCDTAGAAIEKLKAAILASAKKVRVQACLRAGCMPEATLTKHLGLHWHIYSVLHLLARTQHVD